MLGGDAQASLFAPVHARKRPSKVGVAAQPHLHENQGAGIAHHEVDLATPAAVVASDQLQALLLQVRLCDPFGFLAPLLRP